MTATLYFFLFWWKKKSLYVFVFFFLSLDTTQHNQFFVPIHIYFCSFSFPNPDSSMTTASVPNNSGLFLFSTKNLSLSLSLSNVCLLITVIDKYVQPTLGSREQRVFEAILQNDLSTTQSLVKQGINFNTRDQVFFLFFTCFLKCCCCCLTFNFRMAIPIYV